MRPKSEGRATTPMKGTTERTATKGYTKAPERTVGIKMKVRARARRELDFSGGLEDWAACCSLAMAGT